MTPVEYSALCDLRQEELKFASIPIIQLAALTCYWYNAHYEPKKTPQDFIPSMTKPRELTPKQFAAQRLAMWKSYAEHIGQPFKVNAKS